nr:potassium-transporting ATPase subunit C [Spirosomataceae bacterium]
AQLAPTKGQGVVVNHQGRSVHLLVGQGFSSQRYFWSRPSAVDYNAAGSGGSNKGTTNPDHLAQVQARLDTFLVHHPYLSKTDIPSDLLTASGSGLDPHISVEAANVQVKRVAEARKINPEDLQKIVLNHVEEPLLGLFGTAKVNVLQLNMALDK